MGLNHPVLKVNDMSQASNKLSVSAESVSVTAGAQGVTGIVSLDKAPVMDSTGALVGDSTDTSFAWITGTVLTTEVIYNHEQTDTVQLAALANGEFALDYATGKIRYKKDTAAVSDTCNYTSRQTNIEITGSTSTVTPNINIDEVAGTAAVESGVSGSLGIGGNTAHDAVDAGSPLKVGGYAIDPTALPGAVAVADRVNSVFDIYGRQIVVQGQRLDVTNDHVSTTPRDTSHNNTTAYATNLVVKASAGKLFEIRGYNSLASTQFIQVHDAAALPADTGVPEEIFTVPASSNFAISFPQGKIFSTGIVICNSSTGPTKTIGAANCWFSSDFE